MNKLVSNPKNKGERKTSFYILLVAPIGFFIILLLVAGIDAISANPLYQDSSVFKSLENFLGSLKSYTPQAVKALGLSGYLLLGAMTSMLIVFPIWVLKPYIKDHQN
jgi:hypothetical protein